MKIFIASLCGLALGVCITFWLLHPISDARDPFLAVAASTNAIVDTISERDPTFRERYVKRLMAGAR